MILWEIYFWVTCFFLVIWHCNHTSVLLWNSRPVELISVAMTAVGLLGVFALSRGKKTVGRLFWQIFFTVWCVWIPYYYTVSQITKRVEIGPCELCFSIGECVVLLGAIILMGIALYRYAFAHSKIWE